MRPPPKALRPDTLFPAPLLCRSGCGGALVLALVAVDGIGIDARALQVAYDAVGAMLGAREDQRAVDILDLQHMMEQRLLLLLFDEGDLLAHLLGRRRLRRDRDGDRIVQELDRKSTRLNSSH